MKNDIKDFEEMYFNKKWRLKGNPFKNISAEDIKDEDIMDVFIFNEELFLDVFNVNNSIIRGEKGTGKTMLLKAIYNFYNYKAVVDIKQEKIVKCLPIYVNLAHYSQIEDKNELYRRIILKVIEEFYLANRKIQDIKFNENWFAKLTNWIKEIFSEEDLEKNFQMMSAEEVKEVFGNKAISEYSMGQKLLNASVRLEEEYTTEIKKDKYVGVTNIQEIFNKYLREVCENVLLIFDEVSSLDKSFFRGDCDSESMYIKFLNQLRTTPNIYYKASIYPHHYSDILEETRYGKSINLNFNVYNEDHMSSNRKLVKKTIMSYVNTYKMDEESYNTIESFVDILKVSDDEYNGMFSGNDSENLGDSIEQIVFGSRGSYRRIMQICSEAFNYVAKNKDAGDLFISKDVVLEVLSSTGKNMLEKFSPEDQQKISNIAKVCRKRTRYKFNYPYNSIEMSKFLNRGSQDNILYLEKEGRGRAAAIYEFDYSFCVYADLTTHLLRHVERGAKSRSFANGKLNTRTAKVTSDDINALDGIRGVIYKVVEKKGFGFIKTEVDLSADGMDNNRVFVHCSNFEGNLTDQFVGCNVEFKIGENRDGRKQAENVKIIE
ncbi:MAG: cold shock domain-containing protein [Tissierellales bacterium]|nr:cold shock domain-containing protein [Tissierellales bacterium]